MPTATDDTIVMDPIEEELEDAVDRHDNELKAVRNNMRLTLVVALVATVIALVAFAFPSGNASKDDVRTAVNDERMMLGYDFDPQGNLVLRKDGQLVRLVSCVADLTLAAQQANLTSLDATTLCNKAGTKK